MSMSSRHSMESLKGRRVDSSMKLWTDVKPQLSRSNLSLAHGRSRESLLFPALHSPSQFTTLPNQRPVKPTLTTLLRQNQLLAKDERKEKEKVDGFLHGSSGLEYESWKGRKDYEAKKEAEAHEAKKILQAKLAYHKAKAASQNVVSSNCEAARVLKHQREKLKKEVDAAMQVENERRRAVAAEIHDEFQHSKLLMEEVKESKRKQAEEMKQLTIKLQDESRWKEEQLLKARREKIKQIQAGKVAVKVSKKKFSTTAFMTDVGSPDADILIKLAKESHQAQLAEKRQKVLQTKQDRQRKLRDLERKMEMLNQRSSDQRRLQAKTISTNLAFPKLKDTFVDDQELLSLQKELQKFKVNRNSQTTTTQGSSKHSYSSAQLANNKDHDHADSQSLRWPFNRKP